MANSIQTADVWVCGQKFRIKGEVDEALLLKAASLVDNKMSELMTSINEVSFSPLALLAALNLAEEFLLQKQASHLDYQHLETHVNNLLSLMEQK